MTPTSFRSDSWKFDKQSAVVRAIGRRIVWLLLRGGTILTLAGPLIFGAQFLVALRRGVWPSLDLQTISNVTVDPQSILSILLAIPLWIVVLAAGCIMLFLGARIIRALDTDVPT